ncbi:MAG: hydantoinase/oxoprolinase family protein, partial [Bacillota bacterium]|nr:hydantoinase/oxoprolinase family protein [Bacillota bacterium]
MGGTFTDLYLWDEDRGRAITHKVASTPADPSDAIVSGLQELLAKASASPAEVGYLSHGTTVATNTILQQAGAKVGLLTTEGFRDLLEIGRQKRPSVFDLFADKPPVLVPRHLRKEIAERLAADGSVLRELRGNEVTAAVADLVAGGIETLAVCFLHSYANPEHERAAKEVAEQTQPSLYVSASHELTSEFREYERFLTAVLNASVGPVLRGYMLHLRDRLAELGLPSEPYIIQSNGGLLSIESAVLSPIRTVLSGPSAGAIGAAQVAKDAGFPDVITMDMGGTSTDVSLMREGKPTLRTGQTIAGYQIRVPTVAIHTIGAGGGSIAWVDEAMGFHVGPRSAGARPGPACYGLGGTKPTVTDANVVLGRLNQDSLLGGAMPISRDLSTRVVEELADALGLSMERAASGVINVVVSNMVRAVRV